MKTRTLALAASALILCAAPALAREVNGVDVPDAATVDGNALKLNGAGVRKAYHLVKVYVGALYLQAPATTLDAILKADQPRRITMTFLRDVEKAKIVGAWKEGFEKNSKDQLAQLQTGLEKVNGAMTDMKKGGVMIMDYVPGKGTTVSIQGGPSVTVEGKVFGDAILRNWLGAEPADNSLKEAMLGGK